MPIPKTLSKFVSDQFLIIPKTNTEVTLTIRAVEKGTRNWVMNLGEVAQDIIKYLLVIYSGHKKN